MADAHRHGRRAAQPVVRASITTSTTASRSDRSEAITASVVKAVLKAQQTVNADPHLLLGIASTESSLNPTARNRHSSARGLLQFTTATWLTVVRDFGARHGLAGYAAAITQDLDGRMMVRKPRVRRAILALRDNPLLETIMTAERLEQHRAALEARLGRPVQAADLYFVHLLGPAGAAHFLTELASNANAPSTATVGNVAEPNAGLFVRNGQAMTNAEVYASVQKSLDDQAARYGDLVQPRLVTVATSR